MLGKSMKREDWRSGHHIKIEEDGDTVDELGYLFTFNKEDYNSEWKIYEPLLSKKSKNGLLLYYLDLEGRKKYCRVINDGNSYDIIDTDDWSMLVYNIDRDSLNLAIAEFGMERA
ncbi:hypothetical protein 8014-B2_0098 [Lactobacillus phage ATCC 8014-B2]|uniref:Uncharacterized protein n=1 Tax=Lactobacillus phage ATCC 8014-B2 TaxID=1225795 RepID=K4I4G0_9CAUD|nr:hypothetical protein HOQ89_gp048 [Lactobacillus phage ATCC 8014-B2]AFU63165.1 hypothetical protein 8014-B2_0098 [Lactobacillus phage ATCC 8014-B2]